MPGSERRNAGNGRTVNRTSKWITAEKRAAIYIRDGWRCVYCGKRPRRSQWRWVHTDDSIAPGLNVDHVVPRSEGGSNDASNLATACERCNVRKRAQSWIDLAAEAAARPLDLRAGKLHVGFRASRPLVELVQVRDLVEVVGRIGLCADAPWSDVLGHFRRGEDLYLTRVHAERPCAVFAPCAMRGAHVVATRGGVWNVYQ